MPFLGFLNIINKGDHFDFNIHKITIPFFQFLWQLKLPFLGCELQDHHGNICFFVLIYIIYCVKKCI